MKKSSSNKVDRRKFLAGVAVTGAAALTAESGKAAILPGGQEAARAPAVQRPSTMLAQAEISTPSVSASCAEAKPPPGSARSRST